jgi:thioesterase domain-containing protein
MLIPVQISGKRPPLFFAHGLPGIMTLGSSLSEVLGPDQPLYVIHANGIDGRRPVLENLWDMVRNYVGEIHGIRPIGPILLGGMCEGSLAVLEIARELREMRRQVGPPILVDPPAIPPGYNKQNQTTDVREPKVADRIYQHVRRFLLDGASQSSKDLPFDANDPRQIHLAILAGVGSVIAFARHIPRPYPGPVQVILSAERSTGFLHPQMPWSKLLPGPRMVQVLPFDHSSLLRSGREQLARALKFMIDEGPALERTAENPATPAVA